MSLTRDPTDIFSQEREAEQENLQALDARRKEIEDLKWVMAHAAGRRFVWRLLDRAGIYRTSFNHSGSVMAMNEGRREMGLFILAELTEATPDGFLKLIRENQGQK